MKYVGKQSCAAFSNSLQELTWQWGSHRSSYEWDNVMYHLSETVLDTPTSVLTLVFICTLPMRNDWKQIHLSLSFHYFDICNSKKTVLTQCLTFWLLPYSFAPIFYCVPDCLPVCLCWIILLYIFFVFPCLGLDCGSACKFQYFSLF